MSSISKLPWVSLGMMILTYGIFGWLTSASHLSLWFGFFYIGVVITLLTMPLRYLHTKLDDWLRSKLRSLISLIGAAFFLVIVFTWIEISTRILVLSAAALLVRIDLIAQGFSKIQIFFILTIAAFGGYGGAVLIHNYLAIAKPVEITLLW